MIKSKILNKIKNQIPYSLLLTHYSILFTSLCCRERIRTSADASKGRSPTVRRPGNECLSPAAQFKILILPHGLHRQQPELCRDIYSRSDQILPI